MKRLNILRNKKHKVGDKMPVFEKYRDCKKKILIGLGASIVLTMVLTYVIGLKYGLLGSTMAMLSSLVAVWYIMDQYGDRLFKDKNSVPTKKDIELYKKQPFPYHN